MASDHPLHHLPTNTPIAKDEDGFTRSFELPQTKTNKEQIRNFFDQHGFVVIRDVLCQDEVETTRNEFFDQFDYTKNDATTAFLNSPENPFSRMGIIGSSSDFQSLAQLSNRQNERVYRAFETIYNDPKLIVDHDRIGAMRPTLQLQPDGSNIEKVEWQTINNWLHLDCNPATGEIAVGTFDTTQLLIDDGKVLHDFDKEAPFLVQGFLALSDSRDQDGGFLCVPGSHKVTKEWAIDNGWGRKQQRTFLGQLRPGTNDPIQQRVQHVTVRSGSAVIWNAFTLHSNKPNHSDRWRLVQYARMYPAKATRFQPLAPNLDDYPEVFASTMITPLGRRLYGINSWDDDDDDDGR